MKTDARVAVCIPTRNRAAYLREAIESVLAQTFRDVVVLVSDNASTDETAAVVASFDDPRVRHARLDEDIGLVANHNRCFELARTEYVVLLPDDDLLHPEMLERAVGLLDERPEVGLVHSAFDIIGSNGETLIGNASFAGSLTADTHESGSTYIRRALDTSIRVHVTTAVFRTAALPHVRFDPADFPPVDLALMLRIALDWDLYWIARPLAAIRIHEESFSASNAGSFTAGGYIESPDYIAKVTEIKMRFLAEHADRLPDVDALRRRARRANTYALVNSIGRRTLPARKRRETIRLLADAQRRDRRIVLDRGAWRLLGASLLGPRAVERIKRARGATAAT